MNARGRSIQRTTLIATLAVVFFAARVHAANLYLVWDANAAHCRTGVEDMFACTLGATNYNDEIAGYSGGERVTLAASFMLPHACGLPTDCNVPDASPTFQCIEDQLHITLAPGDIVMYYADTATCQYACNNHGVTVTTPAGSRAIRGGWSLGGNNCNCMQSFGIHEVFEGASHSNADDCCNGQTTGANDASCITYHPTFGFLSVTCGAGTYEEQRINPGPRADGLYYAADCQPTHVTAAAGSPQEVCTLARAERIAGRCIGNDLVTCELSLQTQHCTGGCVSAPSPHCLTFGATCTVDAPTSMCAGSTAIATVTCTNTGAIPFDSMLSLAVVTPSAASLFADSSWPAPHIASTVSPAPVAPGAMGVFRFTLDAPVVTSPIAYTLHFELQDGTSPAYATPAITIPIDVTPCAMDAGSSDGGSITHGDAASDHDGDGGTMPAVMNAGCGCRAAGHEGDRRWLACALAVGAVLVSARRRR
jgi:hypothetical protein